MSWAWAIVVVLVVFFIGRASLYSHARALGEQSAKDALVRINEGEHQKRVQEVTASIAISEFEDGDEKIIAARAIGLYRKAFPTAVLRVAYEEKARG